MVVSPPMIDARLESVASALAAATSADEVEELRIRFLGRKAELKLAFRAVRDRETGMTLNALARAARDCGHTREDGLAERARPPAERGRSTSRSRRRPAAAGTST